eukprot:COSAG06_NODE_8173_length_2250_cov_2.666202_1_plen_560_part_10
MWLALAAAAITRAPGGDSGADASAGGGPLMPVGLRTELEPSPFGVRLDSTGGIEVSWELAAVPSTLKNKTQSAFQITVAEVGASNKTVCSTGKVASSNSSSVPLCGTGAAGTTSGARLRPGQLYQWRAQVWDEAGVGGGVSAPATFGTALEADGTQPTAWQATPIWPAGKAPSYAFFRAKFGLPTGHGTQQQQQQQQQQLRKAVAYVTATADLMETGTWNASHLVDHRISGYSLYVNGHWVAQGPGRSEHHTEQVYDAIDITEHLLQASAEEENGTGAERMTSRGQRQHTIASHGQSGSLGGAAAFGPVSPRCQDSWCLHNGLPATEDQLGLPTADHRGFMLQVLGWFDGSAEPQLLLATGGGGGSGKGGSGEWLARDGDSAYAASPPCGISYNCMYPFEYIDARQFPIGWQKPDFDTDGDGGWAAPVAREAGFQRALKAKYTAAVQPVLYKGGDAKQGQHQHQLERGEHPAVAVTKAVAHVDLNASSPTWAKYDANATGRKVTVHDFGTMMDAGIRLRITCSNSSSSGVSSSSSSSSSSNDCAGKQVVLEYGDILFPDG